MIQANTMNDIIRLSYFLTSSFTFEHVPSADEISFGLTVANLIISSDPTGALIPYFKNISWTLTPNQEKYTLAPEGTIPEPDVFTNKIVDISTGYITLNKVNYPIKSLTGYEYFGITNREIVQAVPRSYFWQNTIENTTEFYLYPRPDKNYEITLQAKTDLDDLTLYTPVTQVPNYYKQYLVYAIAKQLINYRPSSVWNQDKENEYQRLRQVIISSSKKELTIVTIQSRQFRNRGTITIFTGGA